MKKLLFCGCLSFLLSDSFAIEYYSQGSASPEVLINWNSIPAGGGLVPPNFITPGDRFIVQNGHDMTTSGIWTIGSATSTLRIQSGGILIADHNVILSGIFQIDNGGTYIHNNNGSVLKFQIQVFLAGQRIFLLVVVLRSETGSIILLDCQIHLQSPGAILL